MVCPARAAIQGVMSAGHGVCLGLVGAGISRLPLTPRGCCGCRVASVAVPVADVAKTLFRPCPATNWDFADNVQQRGYAA